MIHIISASFPGLRCFAFWKQKFRKWGKVWEHLSHKMMSSRHEVDVGERSTFK